MVAGRNDKRDGLKAALSAAEDTWNSIGPESRGNACYRRLLDYGEDLRALGVASEVIFAAAAAGQAVALNGEVNAVARDS
jgi:hypothetical protein